MLSFKELAQLSGALGKVRPLAAPPYLMELLSMQCLHWTPPFPTFLRYFALLHGLNCFRIRITKSVTNIISARDVKRTPSKTSFLAAAMISNVSSFFDVGKFSGRSVGDGEGDGERGRGGIGARVGSRGGAAKYQEEKPAVEETPVVEKKTESVAHFADVKKVSTPDPVKK